MAKMPDNFVDLTITSPPYDDLREYKGYYFEFEKIAKDYLELLKKVEFWHGWLMMQQTKAMKLEPHLNKHFFLSSVVLVFMTQ